MSVKSILAISALVLTSGAAVAADSLQDNREIFGQPIYAVEAKLAEQGVKATSIEAWGEVVRVETRTETGATKIVYADQTTLRLLP